MKFIKVTNYRTGYQQLINTDHISVVNKQRDGTCRIVFDDNDTIDTLDSFESVANNIAFGEE